MSFACVFPGQGAQSVGMLSALADESSIIMETFEEASVVLQKDLWALVTSGPEQELNLTENTQPVMLSAGVSVWRTWAARHSVPPIVMAGHSLGEYTAMVCSGAMQFADALNLVSARARLMQNAVPDGEGLMAAILGLNDQQVEEVCEQAAGEQVVAPANFNAPGQVVIAGNKLAVERAMNIATDLGAKRVIRLTVSVPAHCCLMQTAAEEFAQYLQKIEISEPAIMVLHNVDAVSYGNPAAIRCALEKQVYKPVLWVDIVKQIAELGATNVLEFGPGKVLTGLCKRIEKSLVVKCVCDPASLEQAMELVA